MNRIRRIGTPLLALGLAGVLFWAQRESGPAVLESPVASQGEAQSLSEPERKGPFLTQIPELEEPVPQFTSEIDSAASLFAPVSPSAERYSTNELIAVLPLWMQEQVDVDAYADEFIVADTQVIRVRGRYAWPNGSQMEVEISDLGEEPSDLLLRSVGYNTALSNTVTEAGFQLHVDETNEFSNFEYDYETGEGILQMLVASRFLVEVQLTLLLPESFDAVIEHQVPIALLKEMAAKGHP
jgi:hypothetical protein